MTHTADNDSHSRQLLILSHPADNDSHWSTLQTMTHHADNDSHWLTLQTMTHTDSPCRQWAGRHPPWGVLSGCSGVQYDRRLLSEGQWSCSNPSPLAHSCQHSVQTPALWHWAQAPVQNSTSEPLSYNSSPVHWNYGWLDQQPLRQSLNID